MRLHWEHLSQGHRKVINVTKICFWDMVWCLCSGVRFFDTMGRWHTSGQTAHRGRGSWHRSESVLRWSLRACCVSPSPTFPPSPLPSGLLEIAEKVPFSGSPHRCNTWGGVCKVTLGLKCGAAGQNVQGWLGRVTPQRGFQVATRGKIPQGFLTFTVQ